MKKTISYILLILWMLIIFYLSHQPGDVSGDISGSIIYKFFEIIYNVLNIDKTNLINFVEIVHNPIRELMHMFEYFILAILFMNVLREYNIKNISIICLMICFIYASTDEIHQAFVPNRTFQYLDILMDSIGILIGTFISNKIIFKD